MITGAAGFLGRKLTASLTADPDAGGRVEELILVDQVPQDAEPAPGGGPRRVLVAGDLDAAAELVAREDAPVDAIIHLAAVVSAGAEADFDLGYRVNLDGTRALLEACRRLAAPPRFVFASSVAVFGGEMPPVIRDDTVPCPQSSYGTQKLIGELLVADYARKGMVRGLSVRLPTIAVRPGRPNKAASTFVSSIIREPLQGEAAVCPVPPETAMWILSPRRAVQGLRHVLALARADHAGPRTINLPGLTVTVGEMVEALRRVGGDAAVERIRFERDPAIERIVTSWPSRFDPALGRRLGFGADPDLDAIIAAFVADDLGAPPGPA
ncbi:D-erythronate dehydrogenase [Arenibaculum sp.]|uniref:D-erythronate dehydrogenase n=1 Tax=Arenibaculum sp. TaxID=2865862 RepID=UPI002E0F0DCC|nr:D-erythronate dehydrogenase [Arenibaculum sp.]